MSTQIEVIGNLNAAIVLLRDSTELQAETVPLLNPLDPTDALVITAIGTFFDIACGKFKVALDEYVAILGGP